MNEDMSNLMNQINNMMKNNQIPDDIKNIINSMSQNSSNSANTDSQGNGTSSENTSSDSSIPEFDMATIMKLKSIMDSMKSNSNDPRANLLKSLKPYLKESRKSKVDQYIQLMNMSKIMEVFPFMGGDKKK